MTQKDWEEIQEQNKFIEKLDKQLVIATKIMKECENVLRQLSKGS